jgi:predicted Zn-dependent peptidase
VPSSTSEAPPVVTLPNGVRVLALPMPQLRSACVSVFVRCGSAHEGRAANGIGHVIEHMAFKGTATRDAKRINLDAERLGAEVNAHTDKDHTAFHMRGLAEHATAFVAMLGDIVTAPSFPAGELEHERQVLLHEFTEDEDDPMSTAFKLFDKACFGMHPAAQPVIGTRRNIERFSRDDIIGHVQRHYTGANLIVGAAGGIDVDAVVRAAEAAFGALPTGTPNLVEPPAYQGGGVRSLRLSGSSQTHVVLGGALPPLAQDDPAGTVAAAVFGDGMSSPFMDSVREQHGLAYYAACSADVYDVCGQFVIEASTSPGQLDALLAETVRLLRAQAASIAPIDLERARNQIAVRRLRNLERPYRQLEDAAIDLFALGRVRSHDERLARLLGVDADGVRGAFARLLDGGLSLALSGQVGRGVGDRVAKIVGAKAG